MFNSAATALSRRAGNAFIHTPRTSNIPRSLLSSPRTRPIHNFKRYRHHSLLQCRPIQASRLPPLRHGTHLQIRSLSFAQRMKLGLREASKGIWRKNPIVLPLAIISVVGAIAAFVYIAYIEITEVGPQYHKFPPPVAQALRTGVYYTDVDLNPPKALKAYKEAFNIAIQMGLHPFSDEVLGIKLQVAMMLEKAGLVNPAIEVLERTKAETLAWVENGRKKQMAERQKEEVQKRDGENMPAQQKLEIDNPEVLEVYQKMKELEEYEEEQREKAMKKVVGMGVKLAELYTSDYIQDAGKAEKALVTAVELAIKEIEHRESLGLPVGSRSGDNEITNWLNRTELAAAIVELAGMWAEGNQPELALPLYLRAVALLAVEEGNTPSCKQVQVLNAVASTMGDLAHRPMKADDPTAKRKETFDAAKQWAVKSLNVSTRVSASDWDEMCDESCIAASYNLGEFAEAQNQLEEAKKWYKEALTLAKKLQFEEGIRLANEALQRVTKK